MVSAIGLPVFSTSSGDELVGARLDRVGDPEQRELALRRGGVAPRLERGRRRLHGRVDVVGAGQRRVGEHLAGDRVDELGRGAVGRVGELAVDEVAEGLHGGTDADRKSAAISTVGVPKEVKTAEHRVAMTPDGVRELERHGIDVYVETGAGEGASISDDDYVAAGADDRPDRRGAWAPADGRQGQGAQQEEYGYLRDDLDAVHLPAPRRLPRGRQGAARRRHARRSPTRPCSWPTAPCRCWRR